MRGKGVVYARGKLKWMVIEGGLRGLFWGIRK